MGCEGCGTLSAYVPCPKIEVLQHTEADEVTAQRCDVAFGTTQQQGCDVGEAWPQRCDGVVP